LLLFVEIIGQLHEIVMTTPIGYEKKLFINIVLIEGWYSPIANYLMIMIICY